MKKQVKEFGQWLHESEESSPARTDRELIEFINSRLEHFRGPIGRERPTRLATKLKKYEDPEKPGYTDEFADEVHRLLSAYVNLKLQVSTTLLDLRKELLRRGAETDGPDFGRDLLG